MKIRYIKLTGGCMRPLLKDGDFCLIQPPEKKLRVGDIVLYSCYGKNFLHRIVKIEDGYIVVLDDCGICQPVKIPYKLVIGVYRNLLSGFIGYIYHIIVRQLFILFRKLKNFFSLKYLKTRVE